jgi:predicted solute-binding protein
MATGLLDGKYRIGSVPYLNALPLVDAAGDACAMAVPSELSKQFAAGSYDAALLPIYEALSQPSACLVDEVCIGSDGEVFSVFLAHREPLDHLASVALDPSSRTSSHLLQVLFAEFLGLKPTYTENVEFENQARLLIGDPAIAFRRGGGGDGWSYLDLGSEWRRVTGLPFVFAAWVIRPDFTHPFALAAALRALKDDGLSRREELAARQVDSGFALEYLTHWIRYELRGPQKAAIRKFSLLLRKHGLVKADNVVTYC